MIVAGENAPAMVDNRSISTHDGFTCEGDYAICRGIDLQARAAAEKFVEFMRSAREALMPNLGNLAGKKPERDETVAELKQQIAALQAQIDKMAADRAS